MMRISRIVSALGGLALAVVVTACLILAGVALTTAYAGQLTHLRLEMRPRAGNVWQSALDLRALPPNSRPARLTAVVDVTEASRQGLEARVSMVLNGIVVARIRAAEDGPTRITANLQERLVATRNRIELAVTPTAQCVNGGCALPGAGLIGPMVVSLQPAFNDPQSFSEAVTRFRGGVHVIASGARDEAFGRAFADAIAPRAPRTANAAAEILVSQRPPIGTAPPLRFDTGPVSITNRDGEMLYDAAALDTLTAVQVMKRGDTPVLWVRPGPRARLPAVIELDQGRIALFGPNGREIAFSPLRDHAVKIVYASDRLRDARLAALWRWGMVAIWLLVTVGFLFVFRRMRPPSASEASQ